MEATKVSPITVESSGMSCRFVMVIASEIWQCCLWKSDYKSLKSFLPTRRYLGLIRHANGLARCSTHPNMAVLNLEDAKTQITRPQHLNTMSALLEKPRIPGYVSICLGSPLSTDRIAPFQSLISSRTCHTFIFNFCQKKVDALSSSYPWQTIDKCMRVENEWNTCGN